MKFRELYEQEHDEVSFVRDVFAKGYIQHIPSADVKKVTVKNEKADYAEPKQCFNNAIQYLIFEGNKKAKYVLGYTFVHSVPIEHAWVHDGSEYIDVTLASASGVYVSVVELDYATAMKFFKKKRFGPSLYDVVREKLG